MNVALLPSPKLQPRHLRLQAIVYVRQSTQRQAIEFPVPGIRERMRVRQVDWLPRQHTNVLRIAGERVMRQVRVEVEGRDPGKPSARVEIPHCRQRRYLVGSTYLRRPEPKTVLNRNAEPFHERARVTAEALLTRH